MIFKSRRMFVNECRPEMKPVWSADITSCNVVSRRKVRTLAKIFTSQLRREIGRYEPYSVLSLPRLSNKVIDASVSVCGRDPRDKESLNMSSKSVDNFLENSKIRLGTRQGQVIYHSALPLSH